MNRTQYLLGSATQASQIIEIGAGYAPVARKSDGWRAHVVDHCTQQELRTKYSDADVDINAIELVDTVWQGGPLESSLPPELVGQVDTIIASHVLEHIPDLVGFLQSASVVVRRGGSLAVALPDRRYCFDCFKPWTTAGDLLESHHHRLDRHSLRTRYNRWAYSATTNGQLAWGPGPIELPTLLDPFQAAVDNAAAFLSGDSPYEDCHAWQFSPAGFRLCMLELRQMGLTDWIVDSLRPQENFEFLTTLRRTDPAPLPPATIQAERQSLLVEQLLEVHEQVGYLLRAAGRTEAPPETTAPRLPDMGLSGETAPSTSASDRVGLLETALIKARRAWRVRRRWRP